MRSRHIAREAQYGGLPVLGEFQDFMPCGSAPCYVKEVNCELAPWGAWSACSMKCNGLSTRHRNIAVHAANAKACSAPLSEVRACNVGKSTDDNSAETEGGCPIDDNS